MQERRGSGQAGGDPSNLRGRVLLGERRARHRDGAPSGHVTLLCRLGQPVSRGAGAHVGRPAHPFRRQSGLAGTGDAGGVVIELEHLTGSNLQPGGQATKGLRIGLHRPSSAEKIARAEDLGHRGEHLGDVFTLHRARPTMNCVTLRK